MTYLHRRYDRRGIHPHASVTACSEGEPCPLSSPSAVSVILGACAGERERRSGPKANPVRKRNNRQMTTARAMELARLDPATEQQREQGNDMKTVCATCGSPYETGSGRSRCPACLPPDTRPGRASRQERGYDAAWTRLSARARRLQPFCTDCGSVYDLTADHTPQAWQRKDAGLPIRLSDIDVVCRPCNSERGAARGERSIRGGQGRPALIDPFEDEQCDGRCEGLCPQHRER